MRDVNDYYELPKLKKRGKIKKKSTNKIRRSNIIDKSRVYSFTMWIISLVVVLSVLFVIIFDHWHKETQSVYYPYEGPQVLQTNDKEIPTLWATYRPGAYLKLHTKEPLEKCSVAVGLMWYSQQDMIEIESVYSAIRHICENADENLNYIYLEHDTVNYGHQVIKDGNENGFKLHTTFLRPSENSSNVDSNTDWTTRIKYETNKSNSSVSLIWYAFINPGKDMKPLNDEKYYLEVWKDANFKLGTQIAIMGSTPSLGTFKMSIMFNRKFNLSTKKNTTINTSASSSWCPDLAMLKTCLKKTMTKTIEEDGASSRVILEDLNHIDPNIFPTHFVVVQLTINHNSKKSSENLSFYLDVACTQIKKNVKSFENTFPKLIGEKFDKILAEYSNQFHQKFNQLFPIKIKDNSIKNSSLLNFAESTFSNMAGSLGYFYGSSLVQNYDVIELKNSVSSEYIKYFSAGLLTVVSSRSVYPIGFLCDDGFHGLMLESWSVNLQLQILGHWMDFLNNWGWIPREQFLGSETSFEISRADLTQYSNEANPPSLLLSIDLLLRQILHQQLTNDNIEVDHQNEQLNFDEIDNILRRLYSRLKAWYTWYNHTQHSVLSYTKCETDFNEFHENRKFVGYRWKGRNVVTNNVLNPVTITSGMDDYPRSSHPVNDDGTINVHIDVILKDSIDFVLSECHVDLYCWMVHGARVMNNYLKLSCIYNFNNKYSTHFWMLVKNLDHLHWTEGKCQSLNNNTSKMPMYADFGVHTDDVRLLKKKSNLHAIRIVGVNKQAPKWRFVDSHTGYNTLYPMFFRLIQDSQHLNAILVIIEGINKDGTTNSRLLTKGCGIRSLSKSSPLYKVKNTVYDSPYWRGPIWINIQYLACSSLCYYVNLPEDMEFKKNTNNIENEYLEPIQYLDMQTKQRCNRLYDKIRNDVIKSVYNEWERTGYVWEFYDDQPTSDKTFGFIHKGKGIS